MRLTLFAIGLASLLCANGTTHAQSYGQSAYGTGPVQYAPGAHQGGYTLIPTRDWVNGVGCTTCRPNLSVGTGVGYRQPSYPYAGAHFGYGHVNPYATAFALPYPDRNGRVVTPYEYKRQLRRNESDARAFYEFMNQAEYGRANAQGNRRDYRVENRNRYGEDGYYGRSNWNPQGNQGYYQSNLYSRYQQGYYGSEVDGVYGRSNLNRNAYGLSLLH